MLKTKVAILLEDLSASQLSYNVIREINEYVSDNTDDFVIFFQNYTASVIQPLCGIMNMNEIWSFDGIAISTSVATTKSLIKAFSPSKKYFYVWDLEWQRRHGKDFEYNLHAFIDENINLISRSEDHTKAIKNYCNKDVLGTVKNFNLNSIMEIIK